MRRAPLLAALLLVGTACKRDLGPKGAASLEPPPPLERVAGLVGFESRSRIVLHASPDASQRLDATYVFPARVRWWRGGGQGSSPERVMDFRYGEHLFTVRPGSSASTELEGEERDALLRSMELRRALFSWPDGFDWRGAGSLRTADLGRPGVLQARLDGERLVELSALDRAGSPVERFDEITWAQLGGRDFPASMELSSGGEPIWTETVERVVSDIGLVDDHFLPVDRRARTVVRASAPSESRVTLQATTQRSVELEGGGDWEQIVTRAKGLHAAEGERLAALGIELAPELVLELDPSGQPTHLQLRLLPFEGTAPAGYEQRSAGSGQARILDNPSQIAPTLVQLGPPVSRRPWVLIHAEEGQGQRTLQLVLPDP